MLALSSRFVLVNESNGMKGGGGAAASAMGRKRKRDKHTTLRQPKVFAKMNDAGPRWLFFCSPLKVLFLFRKQTLQHAVRGFGWRWRGGLLAARIHTNEPAQIHTHSQTIRCEARGEDLDWLASTLSRRGSWILPLGRRPFEAAGWSRAHCCVNKL